MRRAIHLGLAVLLALATLPLLAAGVVAVWLTLGRPVLFVQARSGRDGRVFAMRKLRTMRDAMGPDGRPLPDAVRLTGPGRLLRRTRIDELPGLWHVIAGDMALVGPRPLLPATIAAMGAGGRRRGQVAPGLTGWAQVNGNARLSDGDKLALDLWYLDRVSIGLDLLILLRTLAVVVFGERIHPVSLARSHAGSADRRG